MKLESKTFTNVFRNLVTLQLIFNFNRLNIFSQLLEVIFKHFETRGDAIIFKLNLSFHLDYGLWTCD